MKECVDEGLEAVLPPSAAVLQRWKSLYLCYFNNELSYAQGRVMPMKYCVKNPRPSEISAALKSFSIVHMLEGVSN